MAVILGIAMLLFLVATGLGLAMHRIFFRLFPGLPETEIQAGMSVWAVAGLLAIAPLHEVVHAAAIRLLGGRCRFGVGRMAKVPLGLTCASRDLFTRDAFVLVAVMPLVVLSVLLVPAVVFWRYGLGVFALHAASCCGDVWAALFLLSRPASVLAGDENEEDARSMGVVVWERRPPAG